MTASLPAGFTVRAPTREDMLALVAMLNSFTLAMDGREVFTELDLRTQWGEPGFDLANDAWIIQATDGQLVGYGHIWRWVQTLEEMRIGVSIFVHPAHANSGIDAYLLHRTEIRARQLIQEAAPEARVYSMPVISGNDTASQRLLDRHGYTQTRHDLMMEINLIEAPPPPVWPDGISVRSFVPGQDDRLVHMAREESFQDHRGHQPTPFEHWEQHMQQRENFAPALWFLARDGAEIAGICLCYSEQDRGLVAQLGVRRPWRRRGLGMALLQHAFGEFYQRGIYRVELGVDAESLTGATRLYERAGMHVTARLDRYEKELRPGKKQEIEEK